MCYMDGTVTAAETSVGVRELRQNLSVYLERVAAGTVFRVTDRGREVALLVPLPGDATTAQRLVASGRAAPARRDLVALGRPTLRTKRSVSDALREIRADRL
jgi:prevent-host-death family protein